MAPPQRQNPTTEQQEASSNQQKLGEDSGYASIWPPLVLPEPRILEHTSQPEPERSLTI
uniref:Uncharacterized protein n=1 Tax=Arundo donax TaxID=35708 RepID=A0A0A8ZKR9_ARUDO